MRLVFFHCIIIYYMNILQYFYSFTYWRTSGLLLCFDNHDQSYSKNLDRDSVWTQILNSCGKIPKIMTAKISDKSIFSIFRHWKGIGKWITQQYWITLVPQLNFLNNYHKKEPEDMIHSWSGVKLTWNILSKKMK